MNPKVRSVVAFLNANWHRPIRVAEIVPLAGLSYSRLHDLFKAETGKPPLQYHKSLRMEKAAALLADPAMKIKQVQLEVGYLDRQHFLRDFKSHFGQTPSQYRLWQVAAAAQPGDAGEE